MQRLLSLFALVTILTVFSLSPLTQINAAPGNWSADSTSLYYTDGYVGIGTTTPTYPLHVVNSSSGVTQSLFGTGRGSFELSGNKYSDGNGYNNLSSNAHWTDGKWVKLDNGYESWIINNHITPNNTGSFTISKSNPQSGTITNLAQVFKINRTGDIELQRVNGSKFLVQTPATDVRLVTDHKPLIIPYGNVGIGTHNPTRKLSVEGTILAKEVIVSTNSSYWPDYVFAADYKLMPLKDLESFIQKHNHLPNIPNSENVKSKGVSLGEMQRLQMEKIEELTLYTLELHEQLERLNESNASLRRQIGNIENFLAGK